MSQKSILSFFKSSDQSSTKEAKTKIVVISHSPLKKVKNKRKVKCIESDDDEVSNTLVKKLNGENESSEVSDDKIKKCDSNSVNDKNAEVNENDDLPSRKASKKMKKENEEINLSDSSAKIELDTSYQEGNAENGITADVKTFIPKRKTARKQISSSKRNMAQFKKNVTSHTDNELEIKIKESTEIDNSEDVKSNIELKEENNLFVSNSKTGKNSEIKELTKIIKTSASNHEAGVASKNIYSPLKSTKKESIHSFFTPLKKAEDKSNTEAEENSTGKNSSSLDVNDDSPIKTVQKRRVNVLESDEDDDENSSEEASVKKKTEATEIKENSSLLPQKNEVVKSENFVSEVNKTPQKKPTTEKSKICYANQKLGVKSTSAVDTTYDPSKHNYHPIEDAFWKVNEKVPYLALAKTLELIEDTPGRLKTIEILSNYLRSVIVLSPDDLLHSVYLCLNRVAPEYEGIEMGVGETLLMKAVAQATGRTVDKIKAEVAIKGDLGLVSESSRGNQQVMFAPPKLTVSSVFNKFLEIAKMSGNTAMTKKIDKIKTLFVACRDCEAKYIIRSLSGKLRIGLAEQSILCAIARAAVLTPPGQEYPPQKIDISKGMSTDCFKEFLDSQTLILKTAYCECPNYDLIVPVLLRHGISSLPDHCQLSPGVPLKPMLAHPTNGIDKVLERFDKNAFTCEFKYDGERAQIHMTDKGVVKIFSRNQEDNTSKYPDVISRISNIFKKTTKTFILDSEAVAWDTKTKQILPFQVLSTRKRKDAVESEIVVQVCIMVFDLLYLNGESLVKKSLKERRSLLHSSFNEVENQFMFAQYRDGNSAEAMQEFLDESVKGNCEGLMVKSLEVDASYEIAKRSRNWLKLKKDYLQGIGDTLDLVVIGGYYGKGKRTGNYGGFLLACYDEDNEEFQSICKLGTGFKDDILKAHTQYLKTQVIKEPKSYYRYDHSLEPDDWFEPVQVWEIRCADLSISPVHKAATGIVDPEKGISLRFPRFIRIRDDKNPESATNSVQIVDMYKKQQQIQNTANTNAKVEEDFY